MKVAALVVLCGCSQIFGLNTPAHGTVIDGATIDTRGSDGGPPQGCTSIADCPTSVCLPDGTCAADSDVAWLSQGATSTTGCTMAMPCYRLLDAMSTGRPYIRVHGAITNLNSLSRAVSIFGEPGGAFAGGMTIGISGAAQIYDLTSSTCFSVNSNGSLTMSRVTIDGCSGTGINASGPLTVDRSIIRNNRSGGIQINGINGVAPQFSITNTFIVGNDPQLQSQVGALYIVPATLDTGSRLDFNTIVDNSCKSGSTTAAGGVSCADPMFTGYSNIVAHNNVQGDINTSNANVAGTCVFTSSIVEADDANLAFAPGDYHLGAGSIAIDAAMTPPVTDHDIDGDRRPQGTGYDIGADEYP